jgi:hypothetical protein
VRGSLPSSLLFLLKLNRDVGVGAQPHRIALDAGDQALRDVMVVPGMAALPFLDIGAGVRLGQLDAVAFDMVDGADMDAVGTDYVHMLLDLAEVGHGHSPVMVSAAERTTAELVA